MSQFQVISRNIVDSSIPGQLVAVQQEVEPRRVEGGEHEAADGAVVGEHVGGGEQQEQQEGERGPGRGGHQRQQQQVAAERHQVDQRLLAPVLGGQVSHVAPPRLEITGLYEDKMGENNIPFTWC